MSRIGRKLITVPAGVDVKIDDNNVVTVKGPKGTLSTKIHPKMTVKLEAGHISVTRPDDENESRALHGLSRTLVNNMVEGVTNGYSKTLEMVGVGYKAQKNGKTLTHITLLEDDTDELARLIGGDSYSAYAIPHAKEMRAWADRYKASLK